MPSAMPVHAEEITPAQKNAVQRGLEHLVSKQLPAGSFGVAGDGYGATSAITALSGLALMEAGNLPGRGRYGENVSKAVDFVINASQASGLLVSEQANAVMYSHGFATLFLGEVYGMTGDDRVKEPLERAINLIEKTQNPQGGWRYQPAPLDADISVTICQVMALRAARDAGIKVDKSVIDKAVQYVSGCQNADGGFNYQLANGSGSAFPRSAAGVATLYYAGISDGDNVRRGLAYVQGFLPGHNTPMPAGHYFYGHYYAVQAMYLAGGDYWARWYPAIRDELVAKQTTEGAWNGEVSEDYCTAVALIILQMPNRYLPVFNGKGAGG